jgi:hypothetical protein
MRDPVRDKDDLDLLLDSALATYADPGPDSGLEDRVLAALAAAHAETTARIQPRRWRWLPWVIAIPVAACVILLWMLVPTRVVREPTQQQAYRPDQAQSRLPGEAVTLPQPALQKIHPSRAKARDHSAALMARPKPCPFEAAGSCVEARPDASAPTGAANLTALPKLDVFPTPQPLTEQEQALLSYAQQAPTAQLQALSEAQARDEDPFPIATVHIPAFEPPTQGTN